MVDKAKARMRKRNMKLYPIYKMLGWDYIFFYTINFLFLTQVKNIDPADVVLIDSFYALFGIIMQIPAIFIIEYLGRKKSMIFANFANCLYFIVVMCSNNLFNLIVAEILSSLAFGIKASADPSMLNESIPPSRYKSKIFAKISQQGTSNYYITNAVATILAGFLYDINPYIPVILALIVTIIVTIISTIFADLQRKSKKHKMPKFDQIKDIKNSFKFILKSERLKALILFSAIATGILSIMTTYEITLLEEFNVQAKYLCMVFAVLNIISGIMAKKQNEFHTTYRNKSLCRVFGIIGIVITMGGICGILAKACNRAFILLIVVSYIIRYSYQGIYHPLIERYLRNFANEKIDTKIFTAKQFLGSVLSATIGIMASFLLERISISPCMTIIGMLTITFTIAMNKYMKVRVGLKPEEYSEEEVKYDEIKVK